MPTHRKLESTVRAAPSSPAARPAIATAAVGSARTAWLEAEAELAARITHRIARGEPAPPPTITAATPAPSPLLGGAPLPDAVRARLEWAFHADLGAVRVHHDRRAARGRAARAFAAGRHIVVDDHQSQRADYDDLLAHEVAHVLQQAGRRGADGRWQVIDIVGAGAVLCAPITVPETTTVPSITDIGARHVAVAPGIAAYVSNLEAAITARTEATVIAELVSEVTTGAGAVLNRAPITTLSSDHKAYVVDLLKRAGEHASAWTLTTGQPIRTALIVNAFYQHGAPSRPGIVPLRWLGASGGGTTTPPLHILRGMNADEFALKVAEYLLGVTRPIQAVGGGTTALTAELAAVAAPTGILTMPGASGRVNADERDYAAIAAVRRLHEFQADKLAELAHGATTATTDPRTLSPTQRRAVAVALEAWASGVVAGTQALPTTLPDEVADLIRRIAPAYVTVARFAKTGLDQILGSAEQSPEERRAQQQATLRAGRHEREFTDFHTTYAPRFRALFDLTADGNIPSQSEFAAAHRALRTGLERYLQLNFEVRGFGLARTVMQRAARGQPVHGPNGLAHVAMAARLNELFALLGQYDAEADRNREAELAPHLPTLPPDLPPDAPVPQQGVPDHRVRHRLVVARWLAETADLLGWIDLRTLAMNVRDSRQSGTAHSYVALFGTWQLSDPQRLSHLTEDFAADVPLASIQPLTARHLREFFQALYYDDLTTRIQRILAADRAAGTVGETAILSRAIVENRAQWIGPQRHEHEGAALHAMRPGDEGRYGDLLADHPLTRRYTAGGLLTSRPWMLRPLRPAARPYFWLFPDFDRLVARLRVSALNDVVLARLRAERAAAASVVPTSDAPAGPPPPELTLLDVARLGWFDWITALSRAINAGASISATGQAAIDHLGPGLEAHRERRHRVFQDASRKATTYDRVARVNRVILPMIGQYDRYDELTRTSVDTTGAPPQLRLIWEIPELVGAEIDRFMGIASPIDEQAAQVAAMLLEIANDLSRLIGVAPGDPIPATTNVRFRIVAALLPPIQQAIRFVRGRDTTPAGVIKRQQLNAVLASSQQADTWIEPRVARLAAIEAVLQNQLTRGQDRFGFRGVKVHSTTTSVENFFESVGPGARVMLGTPFTIDGVRYRVRELEHDFEFHEAYGSGDARVESRLTIDGRALSWADRATDTTPLFSIELGTATNVHTITAAQRDNGLLEQISRATQLFGMVESMRELGEALETFSTLMIDMVEFVPGAGQAVMAARLAMMVTQFIASGEMEELLDVVLRDPAQILEGLRTTIAGMANTETLLEFFLFGQNHFAELARPRGRDPSTRPLVRREGSRGRLGRMVRRMWSFGRNLLAAFGRVQGRVRRRAEGTQMFLLRKRYVPRVLRFMVDHLPHMALIGARLSDFVDGVSNAEQTIRDTMADVPGRLSELLDDLRTLRLPYQLVDPADILHIIVDLVVRRLGGKYRIAINMILTLLQATGLRAGIEREIANRIVAAGADPNRIYRELLGAPDGEGRINDGPVVTPLKSVRDEIVGGVLRSIGRIPFLPVDLQTRFTATGDGIAGLPFSIEFNRDGFDGESDEAEGYDAQPPDLTVPVATAPSFGSGAALPSAVRHPAEARFGHDFSHVRLHDNADGARLTGRFGAQAITSGSHIFVRPGLPATTDAGRHVLHHELTHVLQQTGPRPLGGDHDPRPVTGAPGRGLRVDPARESAADRAATSLRDHAATSPLDVGAPSAHGLQPTFGEDWFRRVTDLMVSPAVAAHGAAHGSTSGTAHLPSNIRQQVANVATDLRARFNAAAGPNGVIYESPWDHAVPSGQVKTYLTESSRWQRIATAIDEMAHNASRPATPTPGATTTTATTTPTLELDIADFESQLSRHILDVSGILVHVDFPRPQPAAPTPLTLGTVRVVTVHLPIIDSRATLFQQAIDSTFAAMTQPTRLPGTSRDRVMRWTQSYLEGVRGLDAANWTTSPTAPHYRLSNSVLDAIEALIRANAGGATPLVAANLPPAAQYANPATQPTIQGGQVGLRVELFGHSNQRGPERESHHVTQFVLLEFFSNLHTSVKAFPHAAQPASYGGTGATDALQTSGAQVIGFDTIGMPQSLAGTSAAQRGPGFPAVLLSAETHRNARLHIHNTPDEFFGAPVAATGSADILRAWYQQDLRPRLPAHAGSGGQDFIAAEAAGPAAMQTYMTAMPAAMGVGRERVATAIAASMKATYRRIRDFMQPRLRTGLYQNERLYYHTVALQAGRSARTDYHLTPAQVFTVYQRAVDLNRSVFETTNHWV